MNEPAFESAPAKINLALHVTGRRSDGYHDLESLVVFAELGDELRAVPASADTLQLAGPFADALTAGQSNLVMRAVDAFRGRWPDAVSDRLAITLIKNLPVAAGIGGGSADAAAALRLMAGLSRDPVSDADLLVLATGLGADVPVCLFSKPCRVAGIGEIVAPLTDFPTVHAVLVNPLIPVPTAEIFKRLKNRSNPGLPEVGQPLTHAALLGLFMAASRNDLEAPAIDFAPVIGTLIADLERTNGVIAARMSGSGGTVFALYGSSGLAHQAAEELRRRHPGFWVATTRVGQP